MTQRALQVTAWVLVLALATWSVIRIVNRMVSPEPEAAPVAAPAPAADTPHITATLFYATGDGQALVPVKREVPLAEGVVAQGRHILAAQLQPAPAPYVAAIPAGTTLRALYVTERGDAFVDLSREVSSAHPGGSATELLTVYAIVNAVTANLPAVQRVQILVEGREVDTIAGHVDVRRPISPDASLLRAAP